MHDKMDIKIAKPNNDPIDMPIIAAFDNPCPEDAEISHYGTICLPAGMLAVIFSFEL